MAYEPLHTPCVRNSWLSSLGYMTSTDKNHSHPIVTDGELDSIDVSTITMMHGNSIIHTVHFQNKPNQSIRSLHYHS